MSFSQEVKDELEKQIGQARHCRIAELAVILLCYGHVSTTKIGKKQLIVSTEHETIVRKYFTLLKKTFNIDNSVLKSVFSTESAGRVYEGILEDETLIETVLKAVKVWDEEKQSFSRQTDLSDVLLKSACCKRAFLRGCFLCSGSMSDPQKGYHLEYLCGNEEMANQILKVIGDFDVEAKIVRRKKYYVVYVKEGASIVELLNVMEAHISLMNFENTRILKEIDIQNMTEPSTVKYNRYEKYYLENTELSHGIIVDENRRIRDGYIAYLLLEKYGCNVDIMEVPKGSPIAKLVIGHHVEYDAEQKTYVMKTGKRYAWVYTIREAVVPGDILLVQTSKGYAYMQVDKITNTAGKKAIRRYKKVKRNITAETEKGNGTD